MRRLLLALLFAPFIAACDDTVAAGVPHVTSTSLQTAVVSVFPNGSVRCAVTWTIQSPESGAIGFQVAKGTERWVEWGEFSTSRTVTWQDTAAAGFGFSLRWLTFAAGNPLDNSRKTDSTRAFSC